MALIGIPPPTRLRGLPDSTQRQFDAFYEWILRLVGFLGFSGLFVPIRLFGATNAVNPEYANKYLLVNHATATTLTLNADTLAQMKLGAAVYMCQVGVGQLTLSGGSGVTIRTAETAKTRKQWSTMMFVKTDTAEVILNGDLELA